MTTLRKRLALGMLPLLLLFALPASAFAQGLEARASIKPAVMVLLDSSLSMRSVPDGDNTPVCASLCSDYDGSAMRSPSKTSDYQLKSRTLVAREVLTGTFAPNQYFCCERQWQSPGDSKCTSKGSCSTDYDVPDWMPQAQDGILDVHRDSVKFGLVSFDTWADSSTNSSGMWSYGATKSGLNVGVKNESATDGRMISVGASDESVDLWKVNDEMQSMIRSSYQTGMGTPTAAALADLGLYYGTHPDVTSLDPYAACRSKNIIVITDGMPYPHDSCYTDYYGRMGKSCSKDSNCNSGDKCFSGVCAHASCDLYGSSYDWGTYQNSPLMASDLLVNQDIKTYVVGFAINPEATNNLAALAYAGGTCEDPTEPGCFFVAEGGRGLQLAVSTILSDILSGKGSRTKTVSSTRTSFRAEQVGLYEVSASYEVESGNPFWLGHLERVTYQCDDTGVLVPTKTIDFADTLAAMPTADRNLYTSYQSNELISIDDERAGSDFAGPGENPFTTGCEGGAGDVAISVKSGPKYDYWELASDSYYSLHPYQCRVDHDCNSAATSTDSTASPVDYGSDDDGHDDGHDDDDDDDDDDGDDDDDDDGHNDRGRSGGHDRGDNDDDGDDDDDKGKDKTPSSSDKRLCQNGMCQAFGPECVQTSDCCDSKPGVLKNQGAGKPKLCDMVCYYGHCNNVQAQCTKHSDCSEGKVCAIGQCRLGTADMCENNTSLADLPLGDITHSNPLLVGGPELDLPFPGYQAFRAEYGQRDSVVYVGSNDGMLHGFLSAGIESGQAAEGEELFGYIPGALHSKLMGLRNGRVSMVDGSPVARDIRLYRDPREEPMELWGTILVSGLRTGGRSYFALDVTDPKTFDKAQDQLLWELTEKTPGFESLGYTFAQAELGNVHIIESKTGVERAVAILSGGKPLDEAEAKAGIGAAIYVVDLSTGELIRRFDKTVDGEALLAVTGTPTGYNTMQGSLMSRAFVGDSAGRLLRINLTGGDPSKWGVEVFFDPSDYLLSDTAIDPTYFAPALTRGKSGELVVVYGNGDVNDLATQGTHKNFVASIAEIVEMKSDGTMQVKAELNWFSDFDKSGEKLTGDPIVFNGVAYFPTFVPGTNSCDFGFGRVYAVSYLDSDSGQMVAVHDLKVDGEPDKDLYADFQNGTLVFGVDIAIRPSCLEESTVAGAGKTKVKSVSRTTPQGAPQLIIQTGSEAFSGKTTPKTTAAAQPLEIANKVRIDIPRPETSLKVLSWTVIYD